MTTIAYRDGVLAADSQMNVGAIRHGVSEKIGRKGRLLYGGAGDVAWCWEFRSWVQQGAEGEPPACAPDATSSFVILPDDRIVVFHANGVQLCSGLPFFADGSGWELALGAMSAGASAEQAVRIATRWDTRSGGDIRVVRR